MHIFIWLFLILTGEERRELEKIKRSWGWYSALNVTRVVGGPQQVVLSIPTPPPTPG